MTKEINAYMIVQSSKDNNRKLYDNVIYNEIDVDKKIDELALSENTFDFIRVKIDYITSVKPIVDKNLFTIQERVLNINDYAENNNIPTFNTDPINRL